MFFMSVNDLLEDDNDAQYEIMEVERKRSKGGFFQLFDWNSKSRKKLFSNTSELAEESKRGKPVENVVKSLPHTEGDDEYNGASSNGRIADFSSASSVSSDEGYGSRAPGVVARLMGLELLPTLNVSEPSCNPYSGSCSLRASHYERSTPNLWDEYHRTDCSNICNKLDRSSSNPIDSRFHKVQSQPIERFQTEILTLKSVKPIPITHHKLLSPIRSPTTKNAAYIMEAAAKIIEASPRTTSKGKVPSFGSSSSVPLKIWDLKEKIEAAHKVSRCQKPHEPSERAAKPLKGQHKGKGCSKSDSTPTFRITRDLEKDIPNSSRNKGKAISLLDQAKVNVQMKEGSLSSGNGRSAYLKERNGAKQTQFSRSQADVQRTVENGTSANRMNNALRQNNQKQNCISNRDYSTSKTSTLDRQGRKARSVNGTIGLNRRTTSKVTINSEPQSRKTATDTAKELPISRRKSFPTKKWPVNEDLPSGETVSDNSSKNGRERSIKCNITIDGNLNRDAEKMKTSMDVVSFTFTSPITRSLPDASSASLGVEKTSCLDTDPSGDNDLLSLKSSAFSSPGFNIIGGDAMSVLSEKNLQELACRVESSNCNIIIEQTSSSRTSSVQCSVPSSVTVTTTSVGLHKRHQVDKNISYSTGYFDCSSIDNPGLDSRRKWQHSEEPEEQNASGSSSETSIELDHRHPSLLSNLEPAVTSGSYSDSKDGTNGIKPFLLTQDQEVLSWTPGSESLTEFGAVLSASASSKPVGETSDKLLTRTSSSSNLKESTNWELDYVKMMLKDCERKLVEHAFCPTENVMTLNNAFNQLEHQNEMDRNTEAYNKLEQKLLLDCVSEWLESRCSQLLVGTCKGWIKWGNLLQKKGWVAEMVYKEILGWKSMGDIMVVNELIDKDMNTKHGRWLDFDMEAFEEGVEIEKSIFTSLFDELLFDFLL